MRDAILLPVGPNASVARPDWWRYVICGVADVADLFPAVSHQCRRLHGRRGTVGSVLATIRQAAPARAQVFATPHPSGLITIDADFGGRFGGYPVIHRLADLLPTTRRMEVLRG